MKKVAELINLNQKQTVSGITRKPELPQQPEQVTTRLFARMALMYGHKFVSLYGDADVQVEAEKEWGRHLSGYSLEEIKHGLDQCVDLHPSWPPTIGEFKTLCKVGSTNWATEEPVLALDNPSKPETVEKSLSKMMESLK